MPTRVEKAVRVVTAEGHRCPRNMRSSHGRRPHLRDERHVVSFRPDGRSIVLAAFSLETRLHRVDKAYRVKVNAHDGDLAFIGQGRSSLEP